MSFQKLSRTSMENSRTFQEYPTIFQFSRTFQGYANNGEEKSPVTLFTKTSYPVDLLQSILYKKSCHNTHCCRKRSSTDSFPFKCSLINIWSYNKRRGTLESEWITKIMSTHSTGTKYLYSWGAFHLSELTGQTIPVAMIFSLSIKTLQPDQSNPK